MKAPTADGKVYRWGLHITFNKTPGCNFNYNGQSNVHLYCEQLPQISTSNTNAPIHPNYRAFQITNSDGQTNVFNFYVNIQCNILNNL